MNELTINDFEALVNDTFTIKYEDEAAWTLNLKQVSPLGRAPDPGENRRQSFSLLFRSDIADKYLIQKMYEVDHPKLGLLHLFLVPLGPVSGGFEYEAIFT